MKKSFSMVLALVMILGVLNCGGTSFAASDSSDPRDLVFVSGPAGGNWAIVLPVFVAALEKALPATTVTGLGGGGIANINNIESENAQLGLTWCTLYEDALAGRLAFEETGPAKNIAAITAVTQAFIYIASRADSNIRTIRDIAHANWNAGEVGGASEYVSRALLGYHGVTYDDIRASGKNVNYQPYSEATSIMSDHLVDAVLINGQLPQSYVLDMQSNVDLFFIPLEGPEMDKFFAENAAYQPYVMPANTYENQANPVPIITYNTMLFCNKNLPEDYVYRMTKAIHEASDSAAEISRSYSYMKTPGAMTGFTLESLHPGAARYYKEIGMLP